MRAVIATGLVLASAMLAHAGEPIATPHVTARLIEPIARVFLVDKLQEEARKARLGDDDTPPGTAKPPIPTCLFEGGLCGAINRDGTIAVPPQWDDVAPYHDGLARVRSSGSYGYIDTAGRVAIPPRFAEAGHFQKGFAQFRVDGKIGIIDRQGLERLPPKFMHALALAPGGFWVDDSEKPADLFRLDEYELKPVFETPDGNWGLMDASGNWTQPPKYKQIQKFDPAGGSDLVFVNTGKAWGLMKPDGSWQWPPEFTWVQGLYRGRARVARAGYVGFLGPDATFAIPPKFDETPGFFADKLTKATVDEKVGIIDTSGDWVVKPHFADIAYSDDSLRAGRIGFRGGKGEPWGVADLAGKVIVPPQYQTYDMAPTICASGLVFGWVDHRPRAFTAAGAKLDAPEDFHVTCGRLHRFTSGKKVGFMDDSLTIIVAAQFDEVGEFYPDTIDVVVRRDGKYGLLKADGSFAVQPQFEKLEGYGASRHAKLGGKWGLIDLSGAWVVPPRSDRQALTYPLSGLVPIQSDGKWGFADAAGTVVIAPAYDEARFDRHRLLVVSSDEQCEIDRRGKRIEAIPCTKVVPPKALPIGR